MPRGQDRDNDDGLRAPARPKRSMTPPPPPQQNRTGGRGGGVPMQNRTQSAAAAAEKKKALPTTVPFQKSCTQPDDRRIKQMAQASRIPSYHDTVSPPPKENVVSSSFSSQPPDAKTSNEKIAACCDNLRLASAQAPSPPELTDHLSDEQEKAAAQYVVEDREKDHIIINTLSSTEEVKPGATRVPGISGLKGHEEDGHTEYSANGEVDAPSFKQTDTLNDSSTHRNHAGSSTVTTDDSQSLAIASVVTDNSADIEKNIENTVQKHMDQMEKQMQRLFEEQAQIRQNPNIVEAEEVDIYEGDKQEQPASEERKSKMSYYIFCILCCLVVVGGGAAGAVFGLGLIGGDDDVGENDDIDQILDENDSTDDTDGPPSSPDTFAPTMPPTTFEPTSSPTSAPTLSPRRQYLHDVLGPILDLDVLLDNSTPHFLASEWLVTKDVFDFVDIDRPNLAIDRFVMALIYFSMGGIENKWSNRYRFLTSGLSICKWNDGFDIGIICDVTKTNIVTELRLDDNGLVGSLPTEIGLLSDLQILNMERNEISGLLPSEIGNLKNLEILDFSHNELFGAVPTEIFSLPMLIDMYFSSNRHLSGTIPESILDATNLESISFYSCNIGGTLPTTLGLLTNLSFFQMFDNILTSEIPSQLVQLPKLSLLGLSFNLLSGTVPDYFSSRQSDLMNINFYSNSLDGPLPVTIGSLSQLTSLTVRNNEFSGSLPETYGQLSNLRTLNCHSNLLTGRIPQGVADLPLLEFGVFYNNQFSGTIPVFASKRLEELHFDDNQFTGTIDEVIRTAPTTIELFDFSGNLKFDHSNVTNFIPTEIGTFKSLRYLGLFQCNLPGTLPTELGLLTNLISLSIAINDFTGTIPTELGLLSLLTFMDIGSNQLTGMIPSELGSLVNLSELGLAANNLQGEVPMELGRLSESLDRLWLHENDLEGSLDPFFCPNGADSFSVPDFSADCEGLSPQLACSCCTNCWQ